MNVGELKMILNGLPNHLDVMIEKVNDEFNLSLLEKADVRECTFSDDEDSSFGIADAKDDCLVLSDEII